MIPTIEQIVEDLLAGTITKQQAVGWLHQHAEGAANDMRDMFAGAALQGLCGGTPGAHLVPPNAATLAYEYADAMLAARDR
jgi:hypothetical protein